MKKHYIILLLFISIILTSCEKNTNDEKAVQADAIAVETASFKSDDYYTDISEKDAVRISFFDTGILYGDTTVDGNSIEITDAGTYILTGSSTDARVIINTPKKKTVRLILDGLSLSSASGAPIYTKSQSKTVISLSENTENTLADVPGLKDTKVTGALCCMGDLTINGEGSLSVSGKTGDAIVSRGIVKLMSGNINTDSVKNGVTGADGVIIQSGNLNIKSAAVGIQTLNVDNKKRGFIQLLGGNISITSVSDAINSANTIYSKDSTCSAFVSGSEEVFALRAVNDIKFSGGTFNLSSNSNSISSDGNISISNSNFDISAEGCALRSGGFVVINSGSMNITKSLCGIASENISISGGDIWINALEDGIKAESDNDIVCLLTVSGGDISVTAAKYGINCRGNVIINGGALAVSSPVSDESKTIKHEGNFEINGGSFFSSANTAEPCAPSPTSRQNTAFLTFKNRMLAGSNITIKDELQNTVTSYAPTQEFSTISISTAQLVRGEKYSVFLGDMKLCEFNLNDSFSQIDT